MPINLKNMRWEFWPTWLIYLPVYLYWLWLSLRARSFFFFSAANPNMTMGGLWWASKFEQLRHLKPDLIPKTLLFETDASIQKIKTALNKAQIDFPFILKPDRLERGVGVRLIKDEDELQKAIQHIPYSFIIQEYINYPFEAAVFYVRLPNQQKGRVISIATKEFLIITGDGKQKLSDLLAQNPRAKNQMQRLKAQWLKNWHDVLKNEERLLIEPIGNHNRGTIFKNANHLISEELHIIFDNIAKQMPNYYYGRFDLRCTNETDFLRGKHLKIVEVNGANAEPAHMYDPSFTPWQGWAVLLKNWKTLFNISTQNKAKGFSFTSIAEAKIFWRKYKKVKKTLSGIKTNAD